jgi:hypothetical protein
VVLFFLSSGWLVDGSLLDKTGRPPGAADPCDRPPLTPVERNDPDLRADHGAGNRHRRRQSGQHQLFPG